MGANNVLTIKSNDQKKANDGKKLSLADVRRAGEKNGGYRSKQVKIDMKYSPLVERYIRAHEYETMNNVRKWTMKLTERTEVQKNVDEKFKKY